jgi:hypothetical protein
MACRTCSAALKRRTKKKCQLAGLVVEGRDTVEFLGYSGREKRLDRAALQGRALVVELEVANGCFECMKHTGNSLEVRRVMPKWDTVDGMGEWSSMDKRADLARDGEADLGCGDLQEQGRTVCAMMERPTLFQKER